METGIILMFQMTGNMIVTILEKKVQASMRMDRLQVLSYNFVNAFFACIYFYIASGFRIRVNLLTVGFAIVYAGIILGLICFKLVAFSVYPVALVGVLSSAGNIVLSTLAGVLLFQERISMISILSAFLMILAVFFPLLGTGKKCSCRDLSVKKILIAGIFFVFAGLSVIWSKCYAMEPNVSDPACYFFVTNMIMLIVTGAILCHMFVKAEKNKRNIQAYLFTRRQVAGIGIMTALSNLCSILSVLVMKQLDISLYTVLTSSIALILGTIVSRFYFKENLTWKSYGSVALAVLAIVFRSIN